MGEHGDRRDLARAVERAGTTVRHGQQGRRVEGRDVHLARVDLLDDVRMVGAVEAEAPRSGVALHHDGHGPVGPVGAEHDLAGRLQEQDRSQVRRIHRSYRAKWLGHGSPLRVAWVFVWPGCSDGLGRQVAWVAGQSTEPRTAASNPSKSSATGPARGQMGGDARVAVAPPRRPPPPVRCTRAAGPWPQRIPRRAGRSAGSGPALRPAVHEGLEVSIVQIPVSGQGGSQLTSGVEHCLIYRVPGGTELDGQRVQGNTIEDDRHEDLPLPRGQLLIHGVAHGVGQVLALRLPGGVKPEPVRKPVPVLGVPARPQGWRQKCRPILAETSKHDKLVGPGGEAALAPELAEFADDGQQGIGGGLIGEIIELGSGDLELAAPPAQLTAGRYAAATRAGGPVQPRAAPRCRGATGSIAQSRDQARGAGTVPPAAGSAGTIAPILRKPQAKLPGRRKSR